MPRLCAFALLNILALCAPLARAQQGSIVNSKHNLSALGPNQVRAASEGQICIFCHTPHNASPIQPAWNRHEPVSAYTVYTSNSLQAAPGQPTGTSKMCLSCHDGTIAVGSVFSRDQAIPMAGGITTLPPGRTNLGTDLSDDHPISFRYDSALAAQDPHLRDPASLPPAVRLDARQEVQCTTCHDAHSDRFGKFLVMENANSQLCKACHDMPQTTIPAHDACTTCHTPHTAPSGPHLLVGVDATATCVTCHGAGTGTPQGANVLADVNKISSHGLPGLRPPPVTRGQVAAATLDATCASCHEPHTMEAGGLRGAPAISPALGRISGVNASGAAIPTAQYQYEVCFKCHADRAAVQPVVPRQIAQSNTRLEFAPSAVSYHPVEAAGKNNFVPSLRPGLTTASLIYCTDCHSSDTSRTAGGTGPNGPHGSNNVPLLVANYDTQDSTAESATAYALCYRCHERTSILSDQSFLHRKHVVDQRTPCSACHDAHGISSAQGNATNHSKLINFDTSIVTPDPVTGRLEYQSQGAAAGQCFLSCHGVPHSPLAYPVVAPLFPPDFVGPLRPQDIVGPAQPPAAAPAQRRAPAGQRAQPQQRRDERYRKPR